MAWFKRYATAIRVALAAFLVAVAAAAASHQRDQARKWQQKAQDEKESDVSDSVLRANVAVEKANAHNKEAARIAEQAKRRVDNMVKNDETMVDIIDRWKRTR